MMFGVIQIYHSVIHSLASVSVGKALGQSNKYVVINAQYRETISRLLTEILRGFPRIIG